MTQGNYLCLEPGDHVRHIKRGSIYEIMGSQVMHPYDVRDGAAFNLFVKFTDIRLPVLMQVSDRIKGDSLVHMLVYRTVEPKAGDPWLFMRPIPEFNSGRFWKVTI